MLGWQTTGKEITWSLTRRREENIKVDLRELFSWFGLIYLAEDVVQWQHLANIVMGLVFHTLRKVSWQTMPFLACNEGLLYLEMRQSDLLVLLLLLLLSPVSPLCRVSTLIYLRQTMSLGNTVLQLFWCNYSWCVYC